jgi:hypothetical protein
MKYISFPWPPVVAAHDRKTFAGALRSSAGSRRAILYTQYSVMSIRSHHSFQTVQNRSAIKIAYAMTTSNAQGQTLNMLQYIHHGQLYVFYV